MISNEEARQSLNYTTIEIAHCKTYFKSRLCEQSDTVAPQHLRQSPLTFLLNPNFYFSRLKTILLEST
jgi:hypothetical protein